MEENDVSYVLDNEQQFWDELDDIIDASCGSEHQLIDNALRSYIHFTTTFFDAYLSPALSPHALRECSSRLLKSELFTSNVDYVRLQMVYSLLQEDEQRNLHIIASLLLYSGREDEGTFELMVGEGCFVRLVEVIKDDRRRQPHTDWEEEEGELKSAYSPELNRLMLELLYEMSRAQQLSSSDLEEIDDGFVMGLLKNIEEISDDEEDPYHYPVIRVLLVLNEQYMVHSTSSVAAKTPGASITNRVIKVLSLHGSSYMTFSENLILLLNRETETSLQLLILKLFYLIFTTPSTAEYFYTNDLRVLLDVIIRNLLDLPNELVSLRHTYLRVLHPLLAYTQLAQVGGHYKREEIVRTLTILGGGGGHFEEADETTIRLVERVAQVPWLRDSSGTPIDDSKVAKKLLGISLDLMHSSSTISVVDMAAVHAAPGVQTPTRNMDEPHRVGTGLMKPEKTPEEIEKEEARDDIVKYVKLSGVMERQRRVPPAPPMPRVVVNGSKAQQGKWDDNTQKKVPPVAPPRRRTKLKTSISAESPIHPAE